MEEMKELILKLTFSYLLTNYEQYNFNKIVLTEREKMRKYITRLAIISYLIKKTI
jgi:hypothetical protein